MVNARRVPLPPLDWCDDCDPPCRQRRRGAYASLEEKALALAVGGSLFYATPGHDRRTRELAERATAAAKRICLEECPILERCRAYVVEANEEHGVWAGLSEQDRGHHLTRMQRRSSKGAQ